MRALCLCCLLLKQQPACPDVGAQQIPNLPYELPGRSCCGLLATCQGVKQRLYERLQIWLECLQRTQPFKTGPACSLLILQLGQYQMLCRSL